MTFAQWSDGFRQRSPVASAVGKGPVAGAVGNGPVAQASARRVETRLDPCLVRSNGAGTSAGAAGKSARATLAAVTTTGGIWR